MQVLYFDGDEFIFLGTKNHQAPTFKVFLMSYFFQKLITYVR